MNSIAKTVFEITHWDEKPLDEVSGASKITRAHVSKSYRGELQGEGKLEYLMAYGDDGTASFVGVERVVARLGSKHGHFVFQHVGEFKEGIAKSTWSVVLGSGGGELHGLQGEVKSELGHAKNYAVDFRYVLK